MDHTHPFQAYFRCRNKWLPFLQLGAETYICYKQVKKPNACLARSWRFLARAPQTLLPAGIGSKTGTFSWPENRQMVHRLTQKRGLAWSTTPMTLPFPCRGIKRPMGFCLKRSKHFWNPSNATSKPGVVQLAILAQKKAFLAGMDANLKSTRPFLQAQSNKLPAQEPYPGHCPVLNEHAAVACIMNTKSHRRKWRTLAHLIDRCWRQRARNYASDILGLCYVNDWTT